ncbi:MHO_1580 family protein [Mesomycoplasma lagogenitalium]|uniref:Uncharacterized protein n=1 Tax=Mesomycoplasma lagogenitalium TaxID=171286 RepID=A0ABY8LT16_9BACT|nr:hypothetical protein [Mesomycoplasma lagogenitalium]WGI36394.1 hypothetical protein QEG99_02885 [Mesomycoplasma lagogenitalium]
MDNQVIINNDDLQVSEVINIIKNKNIGQFANANEVQFIEIKRNIKNNTMFIKVVYFSKTTKNIVMKLQINNTPIEFFETKTINNESYETFYFYSKKFEKFPFSAIENMAIISSELDKNEHLILSQIKIEKNKYFEKDFFVDTKLKFKTVKAFRVSTYANKINEVFQNEYDALFYNNLTFYSQKLVPGKHNESLFKITAFNDIYDEEIVERDINILAKSVSNLPIFNNEKLKIAFVKNNEKEFIDKKPVIGEIKIIDETYYDFDKKQTVKGVSDKSKRGYIIPYNFSGIISPKINLDINQDYKDINLIYKQKIDTKFLDKDNGIVKFYIAVYPQAELSEMEHFLIANKNFKYVINDSLSLDGLKQLYKKEEDY